jgi:nucleotide-binding universal stress UspA family protein
VIRRIMVPLDGSELSEAALPVALSLAARLGAALRLVHVLERKAPRRVHGRPHLNEAGAAESYLQGLAARLRTREVPVEVHVHPVEVLDVPLGIHEQAEHESPEADLIVMCEHGRDNPRKALLGALAQRVIAYSTIPAMILRPPLPEGGQEFQPESLLVPIDRGTEHERSLALAGELAEAFGAVVRLLLIVPTYLTLPGRWLSSARFLPRTTDRLLDLSLPVERAFLEKRAGELAAHGVRVESELARGDPARIILQVTEERRPQLLVLATHGRSGLAAVWEGSVASKVYRRTQVPLLLVPAGGR